MSVAADSDEGPFRHQLMVLLVGFGVLAFIATLVLGAYAPDLRSGRNGGNHALSNSAVGFSGLVQLAEATGRHPRVVRSANEMSSEDLAIISPPSGLTPLGDLLEARGSRVTLIIFPKWQTASLNSPPGWVSVGGLIPPFDPERTVAPQFPVRIARRKTSGQALVSRSARVPRAGLFHEPAVIQTIAGPKLRPLVTDSKGNIVLAALGDTNQIVLSDPDLLDNHAMGDEHQAAAALALLDDLNSTGADGILFDVSANGLGHSRSPLRLAFDPPFLGVTLVIFAAMILAGWQALVRFGAPRLPVRAIDFGKAALIDNSAALIRKARRETRFGARYAALMRERAAALYRLAPSLSPDDTEQALDRRRPDENFSALARATEQAHTRPELVAAARAMNRWIEETGE